MDIILRLRVLIWLLILSLWGIMVYQFLGEEEQAERQMQYVENPFKGLPLPRPEEEPWGAPSLPAVPPPSGLRPQAATAPLDGSLEGARRPSSLAFVKPLPAPRAALPKARLPMRREVAPRHPEPEIPSGFFKTETRHFSVYSEAEEASAKLLGLLENLHGNLMLDLAAFSPWASAEKVSVFLFKNQETYRRVTGRPAWSGGASSVPRRRVYAYESEELPGILAHELCHIYYDGFFLGGRPNPLWLSEGMATLVQMERGLSAPAWLRENMEILERGGGYTLAELMSVTTTAEASDEKVRLWYAQAYSLVRFLIRSRYKASFYKFSEHLREGQDATQALYRAYGMPFNRLKALEYAWRYDLRTRRLTRIR